MKNGIIGSVTDAAHDYLDFIGFDKDLDVIIRALERLGTEKDKLLIGSSRNSTSYHKKEVRRFNSLQGGLS